jgi:hypothetical protein
VEKPNESNEENPIHVKQENGRREAKGERKPARSKMEGMVVI